MDIENKVLKDIVNIKLIKAAAPLMMYLAKNYSPHTKVIVESNTVELLSGIAFEQTDEYLVD